MKKYYYVQVVDNNKIKFVTKVDNEKQISFWNEDEEFKIFTTKSYATDIATGLCFNGFYAFVVESIYKLEFKNKDLK